MKEKKLSFKYLWLCIWVLVVSLLLQVAGGMVGVLPATIGVSMQIMEQGITDPQIINQMSTEAATNAMGGAIVITHGLLIVCFGIWYGCSIRKKIQTMPIGKVLTPKNIGVTVLIALGVCFAGNFLINIIVPLLSESVVNEYVEMMEMAGLGINPLTIFATVCLAPIGEELIYRGICMYYANKFTEGLGKKKAFWIANTIQALAFAIFHLNIIQGVYAFGLGLCLGYLTKRYNSLIPAMLAHFAANAAATFLYAPICSVLPENVISFSICAIVSIIIAVIGFKLGGSPFMQEATE